MSCHSDPNDVDPAATLRKTEFGRIQTQRFCLKAAVGEFRADKLEGALATEICCIRGLALIAESIYILNDENTRWHIGAVEPCQEPVPGVTGLAWAALVVEVHFAVVGICTTEVLAGEPNYPDVTDGGLASLLVK